MILPRKFLVSKIPFILVYTPYDLDYTKFLLLTFTSIISNHFKQLQGSQQRLKKMEVCYNNKRGIRSKWESLNSIIEVDDV